MAKAAPQHQMPRIGKATKAQAHKARPRERRQSARSRGYNTAWDKFSKAFRQANPLCQYCLAKGLTVPSEVTDHDLPHEQDPELFWRNTFTALCAPCHNGPKARAEARYSGDDLLAWVAKQKREMAT